ncbi:MAG: radical SAM protein [Pseudomonadota bacterium]
MRFRRILLIAPRFYKGKCRLALLPVTGLGYIEEALHNAGFEVQVLDMNLQYDYPHLQSKIFEFKPDLIGFIVMTFSSKDLYRLIDKIKGEYPEIKIITGGPHVSTMREKVLLDCPGIDYGVILEGDNSIVELCSGKDLTQIPGLIYRKNNTIISNKFEDFIQDLDSLAFPKYRYFELDKYPAKQIGIVTSRGCPYNCTYCPVISAIGKRFRMRSAANIVKEITYWHERGYRKILILDDNFTLIRKRVEEICSLLRAKNLTGLQLECPNGIRADKVDYQLLKLMKEAGFTLIAYGVESANDHVLKKAKKGENIAVIEQSIKDACELGFEVHLFFMIGLPGETIEDLKKSFSLALRYPVKLANFYNIIPFPATELFNLLNESGCLIHSLDDILNNANHFINEPSFFTPEMSIEERRKAFLMAQAISNKVRRNYIERKMPAPLRFKKVLSWLYTRPLFEGALNNNKFIVRIKEKIKSII